MRILVLEDDRAIGFYLKRGLQLEGYDVMLLADGDAGLKYAIEDPPDLLLLDLELPTKDGFQVLEGLQGRFGQTSVFVLTARKALEDRLSCLNLGADDYLLKPFSLSELTARCRALFRRRRQCASGIVTVGDLELNRVERAVARSGTPVELTFREFALLEYFMQVPSRVCSRDELLRNVWQGTPNAGTNVVDVYVNYLRKKLDAARVKGFDGVREADRIIETVRGEGYTLHADGCARATRLVAPLNGHARDLSGVPIRT